MNIFMGMKKWAIRLRPAWMTMAISGTLVAIIGITVVVLLARGDIDLEGNLFQQRRALIRDGEARMESQNYGDAILKFTEAVELSPESPFAAPAYMGRGQAYWLRGEFRQADLDFEHATELNPSITNPYLD